MTIGGKNGKLSSVHQAGTEQGIDVGYRTWNVASKEQVIGGAQWGGQPDSVPVRALVFSDRYAPHIQTGTAVRTLFVRDYEFDWITGTDQRHAMDRGRRAAGKSCFGRHHKRRGRHRSSCVTATPPGAYTSRRSCGTGHCATQQQ
jgi:hypothetical protein